MCQGNLRAVLGILCTLGSIESIMLLLPITLSAGRFCNEAILVYYKIRHCPEYHNLAVSHCYQLNVTTLEEPVFCEANII